MARKAALVQADLNDCRRHGPHSLRDPTDTTHIRLLYANKSPEDILARETLEKLATENPDLFTLSFTVDGVGDEKD